MDGEEVLGEAHAMEFDQFKNWAKKLPEHASDPKKLRELSLSLGSNTTAELVAMRHYHRVDDILTPNNTSDATYFVQYIISMEALDNLIREDLEK